MNIDLIFKLAGVGVLVTILNLILNKIGRDDIAMIVSVVGLIICLFLVVNLTGSLFETIKQVFMLG